VKKSVEERRGGTILKEGCFRLLQMLVTLVKNDKTREVVKRISISSNQKIKKQREFEKKEKEARKRRGERAAFRVLGP